MLDPIDERLPDLPAEPPAVRAAVAAGAAANPCAAGLLLDLLPALSAMPVEAALVAESLAYAALQGSREHRAWLASRPSPLSAAPGRVLMARDEDALSITLDRPGALNAIDRPMRDALHEAFSLAALDPAINRVVLRGAGRAFSVGADLAEFGTTRDPATAHAIRMATLPAWPLSRCKGKVEAHVRGACVGAGLEMAAFAHRLTASPRAWFQLPELRMGLIPGAGGCVSVSRRIGWRRTALMILSGRRIDARMALDWGLVDALVDD